MSPKPIRVVCCFFSLALASVSFSALGANSETRVSLSKEDIRLACPDTPSGKSRINILTRTYEKYSDGSRRNVSDWETIAHNCPYPQDQYTVLYVEVKYTTQDEEGKNTEHKTFHPYRLERNLKHNN